jgi:hypothetical protein
MQGAEIMQKVLSIEVEAEKVDSMVESMWRMGGPNGMLRTAVL